MTKNRPHARENLTVFILYSNDRRESMYGYYDSSDISGVEDWINQRKHLFLPQELAKMTIAESKFRNIQEKMEFMMKYDIYRLESYYNIGLIFTNYEREIYHDVIVRWYDMYKDVVVASQILPTIMDHGNDKVHDIMENLTKLSDDMYSMVNNYEKFTQLISTDYIKRCLLSHPIVSLTMYQNKKEDMQLFKHQLFRYDGDEI